MAAADSQQISTRLARLADLAQIVMDLIEFYNGVIVEAQCSGEIELARVDLRTGIEQIQKKQAYLEAETKEVEMAIEGSFESNPT